MTFKNFYQGRIRKGNRTRAESRCGALTHSPRARPWTPENREPLGRASGTADFHPLFGRRAVRSFFVFYNYLKAFSCGRRGTTQWWMRSFSRFRNTSSVTLCLLQVPFQSFLEKLKKVLENPKNFWEWVLKKGCYERKSNV